MLPVSLLAANDKKAAHWPIGAFNRPWAGDKKNWGYDAALDGMKAAGYKLTGLLTRTEKQPFTGADATEEYLSDLKKKIAAHGLTAVMAAIGPVMLKRRRRPALARLIGAATAPLALLTRTGEKRIVPLADPNRP